MRENIVKDKDTIIENAKKQCTKIFDDAGNKLKEAMNDDILEAENTIEKIKTERKENATKIEERKAKLSKVLDFIKDTGNEMKNIRKEFNI